MKIDLRSAFSALLPAMVVLAGCATNNGPENLDPPICHIRPDYPAEAKKMDIEGSLVLRVDIAADGTTTGARIIKSSGYEILDNAAIAAVNTVSCLPARGQRTRRPVASPAHQPIDFKLEGGPPKSPATATSQP